MEYKAYRLGIDHTGIVVGLLWNQTWYIRAQRLRVHIYISSSSSTLNGKRRHYLRPLIIAEKWGGERGLASCMHAYFLLRFEKRPVNVVAIFVPPKKGRLGEKKAKQICT